MKNGPTIPLPDVDLMFSRRSSSTAKPLVLDRENLAKFYGCSHGELGRLLREKKCPLPVRMDGNILWYLDEVEASVDKVKALLERRRKH